MSDAAPHRASAGSAETTERQALEESYRKASMAARAATAEDIKAFDHLSAEGLD